ncbi:MAG: spermidine synthase, partial [Cyanobacteria bacterium]|nr:spermidine synthase [Cyanobacteriota bacterium]
MSPSPSSLLMAMLFAVSIALSASLLFLVEPLVGKSLLPLLGGTPNVWNTCVFAFQFTLLSGYLYAHLLTRYINERHQLFIHLLVLWLPVSILPLRAPTSAADNMHPIVWVLLSLTTIVGPVFFACSTTAPLLQRWFSDCEVAGSRDPYFLYAASNAGSLIGLLSYPFIMEPFLKLPEQRSFLSITYIVVALLVSVCGFIRSRRISKAVTEELAEESDSKSVQAEPQTLHYVRWLMLAFVPSSLVLG